MRLRKGNILTATLAFTTLWARSIGGRWLFRELVGGRGVTDIRISWTPRTFLSLGKILGCVAFVFICATSEVLVSKARAEFDSVTQKPTEECTVKLRNFVIVMDQLLTKNRNSLQPLLAALKRFFPLYGCDFSEVVKISSGSKYFVGIGDNVSMHVVSFNSGFFFPGGGFSVSFGIDKVSGDSKYPSAGPNRPVL
jgi:hypothetical protein